MRDVEMMVVIDKEGREEEDNKECRRTADKRSDAMASKHGDVRRPLAKFQVGCLR